MTSASRLFLTVLCLLAFTPEAGAKDLRKRIGVGIDSPLAPPRSDLVYPASLSVKYTLPASDKTINMQTQLLLGGTVNRFGENQLLVGGRFLYTVVAEDNCNVFLGAGAAFQALPDSAAVHIQPLAGVEFFMFGLENIGLTASFGVDVNLATDWSVSTGASSFGNLGVHYYF